MYVFVRESGGNVNVFGSRGLRRLLPGLSEGLLEAIV